MFKLKLISPKLSEKESKNPIQDILINNLNDKLGILQKRIDHEGIDSMMNDHTKKVMVFDF